MHHLCTGIPIQKLIVDVICLAFDHLSSCHGEALPMIQTVLCTDMMVDWVVRTPPLNFNGCCFTLGRLCLLYLF